MALAKLSTSLMASAKPTLQTALKYALVEMTPPKLGDIPAIRSGIGKLLTSAKSGAWKHQTVREAGLNTLVFLEVICWFYVGECIGKRHYVGYNV